MILQPEKANYCAAPNVYDKHYLVKTIHDTITMKNRNIDNIMEEDEFGDTPANLRSTGVTFLLF